MAKSKLTNSDQPKAWGHFEHWVCGCRPSNISHLSLHQKHVYQRDVQTGKETKTCEEVLACEDQECSRFPSLFQDGTPSRQWSGNMPGTLIMSWNHHYIVLYIRLWMWALQVTIGLRAVGWIFLQHQYLQCWQLIAAPVCLAWPRPAKLWTLYPCPFQMDSYIVPPLERGVLRHSWLCEWVILLFWEGLDYESFVLKNEKIGMGCYFYSVTKRHGLRMVLFPWCRTRSRRVVYGQVKDWFLRSSY